MKEIEHRGGWVQVTFSNIDDLILHLKKFGYEVVDLEYELILGGFPGFIIKAQRRIAQPEFSNLATSFATVYDCRSMLSTPVTLVRMETIEIKGFVSKTGQETVANIPGCMVNSCGNKARLFVYKYTLGHKIGSGDIKPCKKNNLSQKKLGKYIRVDCIGYRLMSKGKMNNERSRYNSKE